VPDVPADVEDIDGAMLEEAMASVGVKYSPALRRTNGVSFTTRASP